MIYTSTRDGSVRVSAAEAIHNGIAPDGGLYVPCELPRLDEAFFARAEGMTYPQRAEAILRLFLTDFTEEEIAACAKGAYVGTFDDDVPAPLADMSDGSVFLELWHGPTCAFKDMALQLLPHLLTVASAKVGDGKQTVILVATSGDTGKAALEGFRDVPGTSILVFYPEHGVSSTQKLQMATQQGNNVAVCAIEGNFDDAQTGVKRLFTDPAVAARLAAKNMAFSSANSINWGRLLPQIVYYISAYVDLRKSRPLPDGINVVVPTGNFGNILAADYARRMGVPIHKLICASNRNNVLTDFIRTGVYDRNRPFHTTISPSMDILISSNLERLLYHESGASDAQVKAWMTSLSETGRYDVGEGMRASVAARFWGGFADDVRTKETIRALFESTGYLCDTHTAVARTVWQDYRAETGDARPALIASTASPYQFAADVLDALAPGAAATLTGPEAMEALSEKTGTPIPAPLQGLADRPIRFTETCTPAGMEAALCAALGV